jgi:hypothetical protein
MRRKKYEFHSYPGTDHLFQGEMMELAAQRDIAFFRPLMTDRPD